MSRSGSDLISYISCSQIQTDVGLHKIAEVQDIRKQCKYKHMTSDTPFRFVSDFTLHSSYKLA